MVITDVNDLNGPELAAKLGRNGREAVFLQQDVTSEERWVEVVAEIGRRFGRLA